MNIPSDVREALEILRKAGYEAYLVGGSVRDLLLGVEPNDYDIATNARPSDVVRLFREHGWRVAPFGAKYGVVLVLNPRTGREFEIATFRREVYPEAYNRKNVVVEYADRLEEDLARRDFTINALAWSPETGVVDMFGGRRDLETGIIRFIGEPGRRVVEDPLRMLRALRFAARLGFKIEPESFEAIREHADKIRYVANERIGEEIVKSMAGREPYRMPRLLYESGLYRHVLPELEHMASTVHDTRYSHYGEDVLTHTEDVMRRLARVSSKRLLRLASMLHDIGKPFTVIREGDKIMFPGHEEVGASIARKRMLKNWRRPVPETEYVTNIVRHHMTPLVMSNSISGERLAKRMLGKYKDLAKDLALHAYADTGDESWLEVYDIIKRLEEERSRKPLITGRDIIALGVKPGPLVGELKQKAYELQIEGLSREEILERLKEIISRRLEK